MDEDGVRVWLVNRTLSGDERDIITLTDDGRPTVPPERAGAPVVHRYRA